VVLDHPYVRKKERFYVGEILKLRDNLKPEFGSSVNPITTRGAYYAHHITASPPGFENPAASLSKDIKLEFSN
jgi:hypothetical protein